MAKLAPHPDKCPRCGNTEEVTFERFAHTLGEYVCFNCEWAADAITGETIPACHYCTHDHNGDCIHAGDCSADLSHFELSILPEGE